MQVTKQNIRTAIRWRYLDLLDWFDRQNANLVGLLIAALLGAGLVGTIARMRSAPSVAAVPTPGLIILIATSPAVIVPTAAPQVQQVVYQQPPARYVVAFAAPDGAVLGPIPWSTESPMLGRYGDGWVLTNWANGQVWVRASDIGLNLANLAPQIAPAPAPSYQVVNQAAPQAPVVVEQPYQTDSQPPAPEPPAQPAAAPVVAPAPAPPATLAPMEQNDVTQEWARQQYLSEHPEVNR
jgi:hypothetical protein